MLTGITMVVLLVVVVTMPAAAVAVTLAEMAAAIA